MRSQGQQVPVPEVCPLYIVTVCRIQQSLTSVTSEFEELRPLPSFRLKVLKQIPGAGSQACVHVHAQQTSGSGKMTGCDLVVVVEAWYALTGMVS